MAKRRAPKEPEPEKRMNPVATAKWGTAGLFAILITHNAFFGAHQVQDKLAKLPAGVTNRITIEAPAPKVVTISYDRRIAEVQRELLGSGHYKGDVDGIAGLKTKDAVEAYQRANGMAVNGVVTDKLLEHMRFTRKVAQASNNTGSISKPMVKAERDIKLVRMQKMLMQLGYDPGDANGLMTTETRTAILRFEIDAGLPPKGEYSEQILAAIVKMQSNAATAD